jgi:NitT/TauT family transport system ATP-binding protein
MVPVDLGLHADDRVGAAHGGREDLPKLAHLLTFEVDDLLLLVDAAQLLGFANGENADIELTDEGRRFNDADIDSSKYLFARQARERAPLVRGIVNGLSTCTNWHAGRDLLPRSPSTGLLRG